MYTNKYSVKWFVPMRIQDDFSETEKACIQRAVEAFNEYFKDATPKMVSNKKYISDTTIDHNKVIIRFETEKPLVFMRRGNALRQFSRFLAEEGFDLFVADHRLMRASA